MHHLRRILGRPEWIERHLELYRIAPFVRARLDAVEFEEAVRTALATSAVEVETLGRALGLYHGTGLAVWSWTQELKWKFKPVRKFFDAKALTPVFIFLTFSFFSFSRSASACSRLPNLWYSKARLR